jgi:glutamine amidotransferase
MIAIIDYGMGNLGSITKALQFVGADVVLTEDPSVAAEAERLVLPGVGAFGDGMKNLRERGFIPVLEDAMQKRKPFLGVCLGMQLLAKKSYEFGEHEGLDWIDAEVKKLEVPAPLKVPHVGWNTVEWKSEHPLLSGPKQSDFYFVHSYHLVLADESRVIGTTNHGGAIVAAVAWDNIFATQFHPEKSQKDGLKILENFFHWQP